MFSLSIQLIFFQPCLLYSKMSPIQSVWLKSIRMEWQKCAPFDVAQFFLPLFSAFAVIYFEWRVWLKPEIVEPNNSATQCASILSLTWCRALTQFHPKCCISFKVFFSMVLSRVDFFWGGKLNRKACTFKMSCCFNCAHGCAHPTSLVIGDVIIIIHILNASCILKWGRETENARNDIEKMMR